VTRAHYHPASNNSSGKLNLLTVADLLAPISYSAQRVCSNPSEQVRISWFVHKPHEANTTTESGLKRFRAPLPSNAHHQVKNKVKLRDGTDVRVPVNGTLQSQLPDSHLPKAQAVVTPKMGLTSMCHVRSGGPIHQQLCEKCDNEPHCFVDHANCQRRGAAAHRADSFRSSFSTKKAMVKMCRRGTLEQREVAAAYNLPSGGALDISLDDRLPTYHARPELSVKVDRDEEKVMERREKSKYTAATLSSARFPAKAKRSTKGTKVHIHVAPPSASPLLCFSHPSASLPLPMPGSFSGTNP